MLGRRHQMVWHADTEIEQCTESLHRLRRDMIAGGDRNVRMKVDSNTEMHMTPALTAAAGMQTDPSIQATQCHSLLNHHN